MDVIDNLFQDWIELYNPNDVPVNLSGFSLTDTTSEPAKWQIPTNTIIAPRGFLLVWADGDTGQNGQGTNGDLHANFQLSRSGEAIALYSPEGALQDLVEFRSQIQNVSYGLFPDGKVGTAYSMENWTPRASNRVGSVPPPGITLSPPTSEGIIGFECGVLPGRTYRVEYKEVVTNPNWTPLGSPVTATKSILQFQDSIGGHFQRYYRVLLIK
jgi:hypothetical protein